MTEQRSLAVGDHVRLVMRNANHHQSYQVTDNLVAPSREPVDGLVLSIRNIATGELLKNAQGNLDNYVIELLFDRTFSARYASLVNAPRGSERATETPRWKRVRALLREGAEKGQMYATALPNYYEDSPLAKYVDGWKVIKVRSSDIILQEQPEATNEATE